MFLARHVPFALFAVIMYVCMFILVDKKTETGAGTGFDPAFVSLTSILCLRIGKGLVISQGCCTIADIPP